MDRAVILIDDDVDVLRGLSRVLHEQPYRIYTAHSADEAMLIAKSRRLDVVVVDERMPGMSGSEFVAWLARHCPEVMRIVLTGCPTLEAVLRAVNEGHVFQYFTKPCDPTLLAMAIRKAMELKELLDAHRGLVEAGTQQGAALARYQGNLAFARTTIVRRVRPRLQAALRACAAAEIRNPEGCLDSRTTTYIDAALAALAEIEEMVSRDVVDRRTLIHAGTPCAERPTNERQIAQEAS